MDPVYIVGPPLLMLTTKPLVGHSFKVDARSDVLAPFPVSDSDAACVTFPACVWRAGHPIQDNVSMWITTRD